MNKIAWELSYDGGVDVVFLAIAEIPTNEDEFIEAFGESTEAAARCPQYDQFAPVGFVPPRVLLEDGWSLCCRECDRMFDEENEQEDEDTEDEYIYPDPVFVGSWTYCSQRCRDDDVRDRANLPSTA